MPWFKNSIIGKKAESYIYDDIGAWGVSAKDYVSSIKSLGNFDDLDLHINSYGGEVFDGFAIYNYLSSLNKNITVYIDGVAASIASYIAMAGNRRVMYKNSFFMIHNPWGMTIGNADDHEDAAQMLRMLQEKSVQKYGEMTSLNEKEIQELMDGETWINAEDSLLYGFATEIIDNDSSDKNMSIDNLKKPKAWFNKEIKSYKMLFDNNKGQDKAPERSNVIMSKCRKCSKEITEGAGFCAHCGWNQSIDPVVQAREKEIQEARVQAQKEATMRASEIVARCQKFNLSTEYQKTLIDSDKPLQDCIEEILVKAQDSLSQAPLTPGRIDVKKDGGEKFREHAVNCLAVASGVERDPVKVAESKKDSQIGGLHSLMQRCLQRAGHDPIGLNPSQLVDAVFRMESIGSSDLPAILLDTANKQFLKGYNEAPVTWPAWCSTMEVPDFRSMNLIAMSNFSDIDDIPEGAAFKEGKFSDKKESVSVSTKGGKFTITRQALINDDLGAVVRVPSMMSAAVARRQNKDVYDLLTFNTLVGPAMAEDNVALFNSAHSNLKSTSGVPSISSISVAQKMLMEMPLLSPKKDAAVQYANISGRYLLTGPTNMLTVDQLLNTPFDTTATMAGKYNPYTAGKVIPIYDAYLGKKLSDGSKANAWYLIAEAGVMETFVMAFLQGNRSPTARSRASDVGEALGFSWDIYFDWGVGISDYRGIIYNDGAS